MISIGVRRWLCRSKFLHNISVDKRVFTRNLIQSFTQFEFINNYPIKLNIGSSLNRSITHDSNSNTSSIQKSSTDNLSELISSLMHEASSNYRIRMKELTKAVDLMQSNDLKLEESIFLIKCCGDLLPNESSDTKLALVRKIIRILVEKSSIDLQHYHAALDIFKENECNISAHEFLSSIPEHIVPDVNTYEKLLYCVCNCGDIGQSTSLISEMKRLNYSISEDVFSALVLGHSRAGDIANARAVVDTMLTTQIFPAEKTYVALLSGISSSSEPYKILQTLREAESKQIKFGVKGLFEIVLHLALAGNDKYIPNILVGLPHIPAVAMIEAFCIRMIYKGAPKSALTVLMELVKPEKSPVLDADKYGVFLIQEMITADIDVKTIIEVCDLLMSSGRNMYALHVAYRSAVRSGSCSALPLLQAMKHQVIELRPHYFWPLIISLSDRSGDPGVLGIIRAMQNLNVPYDFETFYYYILPRLDLNDPILAIRKLQDLRFSLSEILHPMISYLLSKKKVDDCLTLVKEYSKTSIDGKIMIKPLVKCFTKGTPAKNIVTLLKSFKSSTGSIDSEEADVKINNDWAGQFVLEIISTDTNGIFTTPILNLLKSYKLGGLRISNVATDIIADYYTKKGSVSKPENLELLLNELRGSNLAIASSELCDQLIPHPRDMDVDALENHLLELRSKKMNTRGVLRRLLQAHCRKGNSTRAIQILQECENNGIILSPGMQASVFDLHIRTKNMQKAENVLQNLRKQAPWFKIDENKMVDYATFLIREGNIKGSINVLKQYCVNHNVVGGEYIASNCFRLLSALSETGTAEQTRNVLNELVDLRFCAKNNAMLGPVVRAHLNRNDLEGAVKEYIACVEECNSTPLQLELMIILCKRDETDLLQSVLDSTKKVHGVVSTVTTLVVALASANKKTELRRLLTDSSSRVSPIFLRKRCERLEVEGNAQPMEVLAKVCRDLPHFIPEDMYERILRIYCRKYNYDAAVDLYNSMLESDQKPSVEFMYILTNFLQSNGQPLPKGLLDSHVPDNSELQDKAS